MEEWRDVVGYEGLYEVSNEGRVRSRFREGEYAARWGIAKMRFPAKERKISKTPAGYCYVSLSKNGIQSKHLVHRLVMEAFAGRSDRQVNHLDGVKGNNKVSNLEYCTSAENLRHCINVLGKKRGSSAGGAKLTETDIPKIRSDSRKLREIAQDYGVTLQAIYLVKARKNWGHIA